VLSSAHLYLVRLAADTRAYGAVLPIIEKQILYFPTAKEQSKPKYLCDLSLSPPQWMTFSSGFAVKMKPFDVLEYFYLSSVAFIGLRRWEEALAALEHVITYPARDGAVSKLMVEAYKKWVLVGVLLEGKALPLPKTVTSKSAKDFHAIGKPYDAVAQIFETGSAFRLKAECDHGHGVWLQDHNTGLILNILNAYQRFQILNLGATYLTISIVEILTATQSAETGARFSGPQEMENLIQDMIQEGSLKAEISIVQGQPYLTFNTFGLALSEKEMRSQFAAAAERVDFVTQTIRQTDRMLTHEKEYIAYVKKQKASMTRSPQDQGLGGEVDWNEEEELMTGVF